MAILIITRREVLLGGSAALGAAALPLPAAALGQLDSAIRNVFGEAVIRTGKVKLDLPPLVENGNTVPMTVSVDSPMRKDDYVKAIHVFNDKNPQPNVVSVKLSPRAGKAVIATRVRLAGSQTVAAIAEMSDGTLWSGSEDVVVTMAACLEDPP